MIKEKLSVVGVMSGTSLDGLDLCAVNFLGGDYEIKHAKTIEYPSKIRALLQKSHLLSGLELSQLHVDYGVYCGKTIRTFLDETGFTADYIGSHGHTVFHTPETGLSLQIGSGPHIARHSGVSTVYNFRSLDVAYGGSGAPLVPVGDAHLFGEFDYCLNIGGFANISTGKDNRVAWDICPANFVLNEYAEMFNKPYDLNGEIGRSGKLYQPLFDVLQNLPYYKQSAPKSLGREWVEKECKPCFSMFSIEAADAMRTFYEHIAVQIGSVLQKDNASVLCTGGGVHNSFLMERIAAHSSAKLLVPSSEIIDYKEALIFAYLAYLRVQHAENCLASVTGAQRSVCGGDLAVIL